MQGLQTNEKCCGDGFDTSSVSVGKPLMLRCTNSREEPIASDHEPANDSLRPLGAARREGIGALTAA
jgi:hypothetical protein